MRTIRFTLLGLMPLLMHEDSIEKADSLIEWRKDPANKNKSKAGDDRSPAWTWQTYVYSDGEKVVMPYENVMVCLRQAASQIKLRGNKTYKELSQSGLVPAKEYCDFFVRDRQVEVGKLNAIKDLEFTEQANAVRDLGFRLWAKRAKIGNSKHIRVRPRFDNWTVKGSLLVVSDDLSDVIIKQIFDLAGRVGLCDWRPGCKTPGPFGMFEALVET